MSKVRGRIGKGQLSIFEFVERVARDQAGASAPVSTLGKSSIDAAVRSIVSEGLKRSPLSRELVAGRMSEILGVSISKAQLDAWSAESKENHRFPVVYVHAFCLAAGDYALMRYMAEMCGGYFVQGEESVDFAIGRATEEVKRLQKSIRNLRALKR
jgi:hypothetical protein